MAFSFSQQENKSGDTEYPSSVKEQIEEFKANYKAEIRKEVGIAERLTNYSYVAAAYFVGKALIGITFNPTLVLSRDTCKNLQDGLKKAAVSDFQRFWE
jgi:uncharacterized membrane protein